MRDALVRARGKVAAVSPIIGNAAVAGPAGILMTAQGLPCSIAGVAKAYEDFLDLLICDTRDAPRGGSASRKWFASAVCPNYHAFHRGQGRTRPKPFSPSQQTTWFLASLFPMELIQTSLPLVPTSNSRDPDSRQESVGSQAAARCRVDQPARTELAQTMLRDVVTRHRCVAATSGLRARHQRSIRGGAGSAVMISKSSPTRETPAKPAQLRWRRAFASSAALTAPSSSRQTFR